ncbi:MAG: peptide chain release factor N(5)-glutamine methyltransferase [Clostridia bacterium]|nr:peptide chain release factor N(5)-glutamine methyltransferase [Clostridia bacterium]
MPKTDPAERRKLTLDGITKRLERAGVPDPRFDALCLAEAFTGLPRAAILADRSRELCGGGLEAAVARREKREPLQYILGEWEFMGLPFYVSPSCLIPRPDTELLCETAIRALPEGGRLLDMCTGSGCVAVAAASRRPDVTAVGADISGDAISTAVKNAERNGVADRVSFVIHDVRTPWETAGVFDAAAANPPYVTAEEMKSLEPELAFEPELALTDGGDGLSLIRAFVSLAVRAVKKSGTVAVEHGSLQGEKVRMIFRERGLDPVTLDDIGGNPRVTAAVI